MTTITQRDRLYGSPVVGAEACTYVPKVLLNDIDDGLRLILGLDAGI